MTFDPITYGQWLRSPETVALVGWLTKMREGAQGMAETSALDSPNPLVTQFLLGRTSTYKRILGALDTGDFINTTKT